MSLQALTLTHPWPLAFTLYGKDVENRSWAPPRALIGQPLALHGGVPPRKGNNKAYLQFAYDWNWIIHGPRADERITPQARTLTTREGQTDSEGRVHLPDGWHFRPGIVAVATLTGVTRDSPSPWAAQGQHHWLLADVQVLPQAVPHTGSQGLWSVNADALAQIEAQLGRRVS